MRPSIPKTRDLRFDTVRGGLLLLMAVNHIDSDLRVVFDQPLGFVSAAEGFVFLSGILTGRLDQGADPDRLASQAWKRSFRAYLWHAVGLVGVWLWVQAWMRAGEPEPFRLPYLFYADPLAGLLSGLALLYQPGLLDILPMYVAFPLMVPLILRLHRQGRGLAVWLVSGAIWALDQWFSPPYPIVWGPINTGAFHFLSWQWLFVTGVLLGAEPHWERRILREPRRWMLVAAGAGVIFLWVARRPELPDWWDSETLEMLTQKTPLAALRLLNFGLVAFLLAVLGSRRPGWLVAPPLALLGRHPLPVFTISIWCAQIALSYPEAAYVALGRWIETALVFAGMFATAWACEYAARRRKIARERESHSRTDPRPDRPVVS